MPSKKNVIKVYVDEEEHALIRELADRTGLSLSTFAKRVCLGQEAKSLVDPQVRHALRQIHGELGRVGGLLKQLLVREIVDKHTVHRHLRELDIVRSGLRETWMKI